MKPQNLDPLITTWLDLKIEKLNDLTESGLNYDSKRQLINQDIDWLLKIVRYEGYDITGYLNYYRQGIRK